MIPPRFSLKQLEDVSLAYNELVAIHPELKKLIAETKARKAPEDLERLERMYKTVRESLPDGEQEDTVQRLVQELIVLEKGRPSLLISDGIYDLAQAKDIPTGLRDPLRDNLEGLREALRGVGRIECLNHQNVSWVGTGFIVKGANDSDLLVTNMHVAVRIAYKKDGEYRFVSGMDASKPMKVLLDLNEEAKSLDDDESGTIQVAEVLHIEDGEAPDLAILRLDTTADSPKFTAMKWATEVSAMTPVGAIGYPMDDTTVTKLEAILRLLGQVYGKKRLAPGLIKEALSNDLIHDCSTLGGNSGSPLVDLKSGEVVGLHYGGSFPNPRNHAVPAHIIAERISNLQHRRPRKSPIPTKKESMPEEPKRKGAAIALKQTSANAVSFEVPLRITVELGAPRDEAFVAQEREPEGTLEQAVDAAKDKFGSLPGVGGVRSGLLLVNGQYSKDNPGIIISIDYAAAGSDKTVAAIPSSILSFPIQVRAVTPEDLLRMKGFALEAVPRIRYRKPADLSLDEVDEIMDATFHSSPDAGWPELEKFLKGTRERLTVGMYNITADHVKDGLLRAVRDEPARLDLVLADASLDDEETQAYEVDLVEDFSQRLGERFRYEFADGRRRLFAGNYHIKVAVRDSSAFWLSSGNWEDSNQPDIDPIQSGERGWQLLRDHNREWHAIIENEKLAKTFEAYLQYDLTSYRELRTVSEAPPEPHLPLFLVPTAGVVEEAPRGPATYFEPLVLRRKRLRIQPLLTPDNFLEHVMQIVNDAEESIDLQNQAFKWNPDPAHPRYNVDPRFMEFVDLLLQKHRDNVKVRMILRSDYSPEMKEILIDHGFSAQQIRLQSKCHTKGIVIDSKIALIGSHNLTDHGALANRDASLIVHDSEVAKFYGKLFQFDWDRAQTRVRETPPGISIYKAGAPVPPGYEVVSLEGSL